MPNYRSQDVKASSRLGGLNSMLNLQAVFKDAVRQNQWKMEHEHMQQASQERQQRTQTAGSLASQGGFSGSDLNSFMDSGKFPDTMQTDQSSDINTDEVANDLASGNISPQFFRTLMGYGSKGASQRMDIYNKAKEINPNFSQSQNEINFAGKKSSTQSFERMANIAESSAKTARKNLDLAVSFSEKVGRTGSPLLNKVWLSAKQNVWNDPDAISFRNTIITSANEYAKVMTGQTTGQAVSDAARHEAQQLLGQTFSKEAFQQAVDTMHQEMDNRLSALNEQRQEMRSGNNQSTKSEDKNLSDEEAFKLYQQSKRRK